MGPDTRPRISGSWWRWVLATAVGYYLVVGPAIFLSFIAIIPMGDAFDMLPFEAKPFQFAPPFITVAWPSVATLWFLTGTSVGMCQLMVSLRPLRGFILWAPATGFAWVLGRSISGFLTYYPVAFARAFDTFLGPNLYAYVFAGLVTGLMIGLVQWLFLRGSTPLAGWWIATSALGLAIGILLSRMLLGLSHIPMTGPIYGVITAGALAFLLYRSLKASKAG